MLRDLLHLLWGYPGRFTRWKRQHFRHIAAVAVQLSTEIPAARRRITAQRGDAAECAASRDRLTAVCTAAGIAPREAATISTVLTEYLWEGGGRADQVEEGVWRAMLLLNRTAGGLQTPEGRMILPLGQAMTPRAIGALIYKVIGDHDYPESLWWRAVTWMLATLLRRSRRRRGSKHWLV
jgi:hypothetical protein